MEKPTYYVYYTTTSSFSPKEKRALYDLFGSDFFTKDQDKDLSDDQVQRILSRVKPAMKKWLNTHDLLPFLKRHHVLTDSELQLLSSSTLAHREQAIRLAEFLMNKGSYGIAAFYLSLVESSEQLHGLPAHYQLAGELKQTVHAEYGVGSDDPLSVDNGSVVTTSSIDSITTQSLQFSLRKLRDIKLPRPTAVALLGNLGLSPEDIFSTVPSSLERVCSIWVDRETNPFTDDLIQALVLTKTTGRYASLLCSTEKKSESPGVRNFFLTLGGQWELVAEYLGYSKQEVDQILQKFPDSIENQVGEFLDMWQLPSTGQLSLPLLHKLKALSGVTSEYSQSRKLTERKDIPSYVYMNKRLKTDAAGIPHRSLDSYQHSPSRAQAFKAPYDSFTSHKSLSPPPSSPPKPPRSYSSTSNYPRGSYPGPNSRMSQQTSENDKSGSLDNSRSHYNSPGTSSTYGNETIATFRLRITAGTGESPRRPPPPPPPTSPGSHDPRVQGVDTYALDPNRSQPSSTGPRFLVMLFTGGDSHAGGMYGHTEEPYHHHGDDVPVIEELPDDYPMEMIEDKSADGSSLPPLSDGRASPADELNNLDQLGDRNDVNDLPDLGDHNEQDDVNELNDLSAVTPPSSHPQSPVHPSQKDNQSFPPASPSVTILTSPPGNTSTTPTLDNQPERLDDQPEATAHTVVTSAENQQVPMTSSLIGHMSDHDDNSLPPAVPPATLSVTPPDISANTPPSNPPGISGNTPVAQTLSDQGEAVSGTAETTAEDQGLASVTTPPNEQEHSVVMDKHSSTYPPSSTIGDHEAVTTSEISSSIPGQPAKEAAAQIPKLEGDVQKQPAEPQDDNNTLHEKPKSFEVAESEAEALQHIAPVISLDLQAPDRRYHSRGRLDSLEDRNNLDTDSEMQSLSESEKESDTESYPGTRLIRKRLKRTRRSSTSISSSEDEKDPFPDPRNDLSIVSSPEHELPPDGGGFGISLSVGDDIVPTTRPNEKHNEQPTLNDLTSQMPPPNMSQLQKLDVSMTENLSEPSDKYTSRNLREESAMQVDAATLTLPESKKIGLLDEDTGHETRFGSSSPRIINEMLQEKPMKLGQPKPLLSEQEHHAIGGLLKPDSEGTATKFEPYQPLSDPGTTSQHLQSGLIPSSEEEPMRIEPTHQVTRTSDQVLESASYSTSSSDQLQPPVRKSFSSLPPSIPPSLDRDYLLKPPTFETPPVSLSAPSTGLHSMLDQPPPPFTHYAAPPPIFMAHVLEQRAEDMDVGDFASQGGGSEEKETVMDEEVEERNHSSAGMRMEDLTGQRPMQDSLLSMPVHHSLDDRSTGSTAHLISSLDKPPMTRISSLQSSGRDYVDRQPIQPPRGFLSQDIVQALEDPNGAEVLFALLESGANIDVPTKDGEYAVHIAVRVERGLEKLKLLLQGNANRNVTRSVDLRTALHLACLKQDLEMVQLLLDSEEANPCPQDSRGFTPLHFRQTLENIEITKCLINRGAAVDIPSKDGFITPLLVCCVVGNSTYDAANLLVRSNANVNGVAQASTKPLIAASAVGYEAMVQLLLEHNADINTMDQDQCTSLLKACLNKHVSVAKRLCQRNFVDVNAPNKDNVTPLMAAVSNNAQDLVGILIQNGAYLDVSRLARVSLPGGEAREFEITPMAVAAVRGYLEIIEIIVQYGGQINAINERALPPITGAVLAGHFHVVEFFTKQNDLDCSLEGLTQPFIMAVRCGNQLCAELILERYSGGIDMMLRSASDQGSEELVECIETFQQASLESSAEPPRVFLLPGQLPWDEKPHPTELKAEDSVLKILSSIQSINREPQLNDSSEVGHTQGQQREHHHSDHANAVEPQNLQALVTSGPPPQDTTSVHQSSAGTFVPTSRADSDQTEDTTAATVLSKVGPQILHESSSPGQGATSQEGLPHEDDDELNQFDDDSSSDGSESVQVLHVDDPRLAFGQSVYVGRRDGDEFTYRPPVVASREGQSSNAGRMNTSMAGSVHTVTAPSSLSGGLVSSSDVLSRKLPHTPYTAGSTPLSAAAGTLYHGPPPVSVPSMTPTPLWGTQPQRQPPTPSVAQSVPASLPLNSSNAPMSSLGLSASMPPLRARAVDVPGAGLSDEDRSLFAPRPKSPPPKATPPSPVHPTPISLKTPTSMASSVVEVLHEFAQITISAAIGRSKQETIIERAIGSEFEHVATFFLNYFFSPAEFARGGNLVSEFIGGTPSPLNFLLVKELVTKDDFKKILSEMGRTEFVEQLAMVLHQFPGSDYLPWAGEEMLTALFTRAFSIGSLHPSMTSSKSMTSSVCGNTNPSSMAGRDSPPIPHEPPRADSPPPPKPISGPAPEKQHTFPETGGHRLGRGSADDAKINNPRNIVTPSAVPSRKTEPTVTRLSGSTTVAGTTTTQQLQQEKDGGPLIKKPKLTGSHESLNSTASSGQQLSVHSGSERWGQQETDSHRHTKKTKLTASHESLNSTTSSGQRSVHSNSKKLSEDVEKSANGSEQRQLMQNLLAPTERGAKAPMKTGTSAVPNATVATFASASAGTLNIRRFGNEVEHPLRRTEHQDSQLLSGQTPSSISVEECDSSSFDELNDLDRTTPVELRQPFPQASIGVPLTGTLTRSGAIHKGDGVKDQPVIREHGEEQLGDELHLKEGLKKVPLPSLLELQATPSPSTSDLHTETHTAEPSQQNMIDEDEINDLDSDDDTHIPGGPAFDVIDNVSWSMARKSERPPLLLSLPAAFTAERQHQAEASSEGLPPPGPFSSGPTSNPGFMQSLTVPSKSDIPGSLKSTYGTESVGTLDLLYETSDTSTAPNVDVIKQRKSEVFQPLLGATNDSSKLEHKEQAGDESKKKSGISLLKQHDLPFPKTDSKGFVDHHKAQIEESLLKLPNVKDPEYFESKLDSNEQTFTQPNMAAGVMVVQDYQGETEEQSKSLIGSSPASHTTQGSQQSKSLSISPQHPTDSSLMSRKSSNSSPSDALSLPQPLYAADASHEFPLKPMELDFPPAKQSLLTDNVTPRLKQQGISEKRLDISTLPGSRRLEDSDSTDTETDEESRVSMVPPSWRLTSTKESKPTVRPDEKPMPGTVDRDNTQLAPSTSSGMVEFSTGGAWHKKHKQTRTPGPTLPEDPSSKAHASASQLERPKAHKQLDIVDDQKRKTHSVPKMRPRSPQEKSSTPLTHHAIPKAKVTPPSSTTRLKTATTANAKKLTTASKATLAIKKTHSTQVSSQSPALSKKASGASKKVPISSPSLRHKQQQNLPKSSPKEPVIKATERRKQLLHNRTSKPSMTPPSTKKSSASAQRGKTGEVNQSEATRHEKVVKAKPGIPKASHEVHIEKLVSASEDEQTVHATHRVESDYSSTTVGSRDSLLVSESSLLPWSVSISLIATNTEQIFGITIPNVVICGDKEGELLEAIAMRVNKWKMLGRYLDLEDDILDEIEIQNHFVGERCLKMLKKFQTVSGDEATYVRLATALKNIMQDSLITDISHCFPKHHLESTSAFCVPFTVKPTINLEEMYTRLSVIRENFELQRSNGKRKATLKVSYLQAPTTTSRTNSPLCFELTSLDHDSVRVIEDMCIAAAVRKVKQLSVTISYE